MKQLCPDTIKILETIKEESAGKEKVVFVSGDFNVVHPGHLRLLRFAAECGDFLIVGVKSDEISGISLLEENLRLEGIESISSVNLAFILKDSPEKFIEQLKPAIVVKGKEHESRHNLETDIMQSYGGKLLFSSGEVSFSSLDLLRDEFKHLNYSAIVKPIDYPERHGFELDDIKSILQKIMGLKVLVIGETIVDEYITCDAVGMSREDPTVVVTPLMKEQFVGGAGIVAAHARGMGASVNFFSIIGKDNIADFVRKTLQDYDVTAHLYEDESRPTILKQRFRAEGKTLLRVNHYHKHAINREIQDKIFDDLVEVLDGIDLLMFSDFNYGCLPQGLVNRIAEACQKRNIMMVADSQSSSQIGDVSRFKDMALLTPTEREARLAVGDFESGLVVLAEALRMKSKAKNILLTMGSEGVLLHAATSSEGEWITDQIPSMNTAPRDVSGAGDSLFTCVSMAMAVGSDIWKSAYLGSLAAACQLSRLGNIPLTSKELQMEIKS